MCFNVAGDSRDGSNVEDLTNEQQEKAKACKTYEERLAFIEECGIELEDDMLDDVSGGGQPSWDKTRH